MEFYINESFLDNLCEILQINTGRDFFKGNKLHLKYNTNLQYMYTYVHICTYEHVYAQIYTQLIIYL